MHVYKVDNFPFATILMQPPYKNSYTSMHIAIIMYNIMCCIIAITWLCAILYSRKISKAHSKIGSLDNIKLADIIKYVAITCMHCKTIMKYCAV